MPKFAVAVVVACIGLGCACAQAERITLTVATFPDLDRAAKAAAPAWAKLHPDVELKIVSLQYPDHHTAMTTALATTLAKKGFRAQPVIVAHSVAADAARQQALRAGADRAVVLTMREWKSDTAMRVRLLYDVTLTVLDPTGTVLAEKRVQGDDTLGAASLPSQVGDIVAAAFKTKLEQMLDDPRVSAALTGGA